MKGIIGKIWSAVLWVIDPGHRGACRIDKSVKQYGKKMAALRRACDNKASKGLSSVKKKLAANEYLIEKIEEDQRMLDRKREAGIAFIESLRKTA